jgi:hypothetical protein
MIAWGLIAGWIVTTLYLTRELGQARRDAAIERKELEDRLMALSQPTALSQIEGNRDPVPGTVGYVEDEMPYAPAET